MWHLLPLHLCKEHEELLNENLPSGPVSDATTTSAFKLLAKDANARVVVNFHGNAAHIGSAFRPEAYRALLGISTPSNPVHVFAFDYRGYGESTGSPTEEGVITDAITLLNFLTAPPLSIPPSRIALVGTSLGTAIATAVAERFAFGAPESAVIQPAISTREPFAGVILLAPFSNLPKLIESYSFKGLTPPLLSPLIGYPRVQKYLVDCIVDRWDTATRVARLTGVSPVPEDEPDSTYSNKPFDLTIIHARDDVDIPWREGRRVWQAATGENNGTTSGKLVYERVSQNGLSEVEVWEKVLDTSSEVAHKKGVKRVRWEKVAYGGHNRIATYSVAALAVLRAFEE
ncbi:Alpha/Beta hydrolase fold [Elaphomyces granulatus]